MGLSGRGFMFHIMEDVMKPQANFWNLQPSAMARHLVSAGFIVDGSLSAINVNAQTLSGSVTGLLGG